MEQKQMIKQNLIITYSNQKAREIKKSLSNPFDKVITLNSFIDEFFDQFSFKKKIEQIIAISFIYKTIQEEDIKYFDFIEEGSETLDLIYDFILKVNASNIDFLDILSKEKLKSIELLNKRYLELKEEYKLVDYNDLVSFTIENMEQYSFDIYEQIFIDDFEKESIKFYKSFLESKLIDKLTLKAKKLDNNIEIGINAKLYKLEKQPFDINDEVQSSLKLTRKLLEDNNDLKSSDICIVTTDINEYSPIFRLYLEKYGLKGFDSKGKALNLYIGKKNSSAQVLNAFENIDKKLKLLKKDCKKFNINIDITKLKEKMIKDTFILEDKIGIELTEANQLLGLNKSYKHLIFIGTDINHFPPKRNDNFLYTSDIAQKYFCENSYYESSLLQYNELKRISNNLYITHPKYKEKRKLSSSIIIDKNIENMIDISMIKGKKEKIEDEEYLKSISINEFTKYDGLDVKGLKVNHLSASQLGSYSKCPLKYLYNYKLGIKKPKDEEDGFDIMQQGTLMHSCFEEFSKEVKANIDLNLEDFKSIMSRVLEIEYKKFLQDPRNEIKEENVYHRIYKYTLAKGLKDNRKNGLLINFINYYDEKKEELNYFANSEFEKKFTLDNELNPYTLKNKDDKDYFIKGYIDRFDNLKEHINIIDYKSKKTDYVLKDKLEEIRDFKDYQLGLYTLYSTKEYKKDIDSYLLTFKTDKKTFVKFARVATNEDFIPLNRGNEIGVLYDEEYENDLKTNIFTIKNSIEEGDFRFDNSNEDYCGYCEIKNMCNEGLLNKGENNELK